MGTSVAVQRQQQVKGLLETRRDEFSAALAGRIDPDAFVRVAYSAITKSPKLLEATSGSLLMALLEAASLGLTPNGVMGEAYLVPFNNKIPGGKGEPDRWEVQAQFIPGYRGLIKLARQSGVVRTIVPRAVHDGDHFELEYGLDERLVHVPLMDGDDRPLTHVYAVARLSDGGSQFEVMSRQQVDAVRAVSKSKDRGPWVDWYEAMALKTVIRRLFKYLPSSDYDLTRALEADSQDYEERREIGSGASLHLPAQTRTERVLEQVSTFTVPRERIDLGTGEVLDAVAEPLPEEPLEPAKDPLVLLWEKAAIEPSGKGKAASDPQRERIREIAGVIAPTLDESDPLAERLLHMAAQDGLSTGHAGSLISLGKDAAAHLALELPSERAAGDEETADVGQEDLL